MHLVTDIRRRSDSLSLYLSLRRETAAGFRPGFNNVDVSFASPANTLNPQEY